MIPVYICDDEPFIRENLTQIVDSQILILDCDMGPVRALEDPDELLRAQREASVPAIYFLDIDFPGKMSGLVLAQKLRQYDPRGFIIFITAHCDLAFERSEVEAEITTPVVSIKNPLSGHIAVPAVGEIIRDITGEFNETVAKLANLSM